MVDQPVGIAFRGKGPERLDVWQLVDAYRDIGSVEIMAKGGSVSEHQIQLALDYYKRDSDEIDAAIAENRRPIQKLEASSLHKGQSDMT